MQLKDSNDFIILVAIEDYNGQQYFIEFNREILEKINNKEEALSFKIGNQIISNDKEALNKKLRQELIEERQSIIERKKEIDDILSL